MRKSCILYFYTVKENWQAKTRRYFPRPITHEFFRNAAVGMKWGKQAIRVADASKCGLLEGSLTRCLPFDRSQTFGIVMAYAVDAGTNRIIAHPL